MNNETAREIAAITDEGKFELLATAVMRVAEPRYIALSHPGVNPKAKRSNRRSTALPSFPARIRPHMLAAHHTTTKAKNLEPKWLFDPAKATPRKNAPTTPTGDIVKTAAIVAEERKRAPDMLATLALSTSIEPPEDLVRDAHAIARANRIELDLWPGSRLATFLDSPKGQWIRHQHLGIPQQRVSTKLLAELSRKSLEASRPVGGDPDTWVERAVDASLAATDGQMIFVTAEAGLGKTVACHKLLAAHVSRGGIGLTVSHQLIDQAPTVTHAVDLALRQLHPYLAPEAGADALLQCEAAMPFYLVIEDINRSGHAVALLEKIATWGQTAQGKSAPLHWRLFCPVWPQILMGATEQVQKSIAPFIVTCPFMTTNEGTAAVQRRAAREKQPLSEMDARTIAEALGLDPLLIGLHDLRDKPDPYNVVTRFIGSSLARSATRDSAFNSSDYQTALRALSMEMLTRRNLEPSWPEMTSWFVGTTDTLPALRALAKHGEVIRFANNSIAQRLAFRHDRVRDTLLTGALTEQLVHGNVEPDLLADPFFAELFGRVLAAESAHGSLIAELTSANPLSLFHALSHATKSPERAMAIANAIMQWLTSPEGMSRRHHQLRWEAQQVLSNVDSPHVRPIAAHLTPAGWYGLAARLRNGDVSAGLELSMQLEPGVNNPWRDSFMDHVKLRFGVNLIKVLGDLLRQPELPQPSRLAAVRFAGHLADARLGESLMTSWRLDGDRTAHLADYLIAAGLCCGDNAGKNSWTHLRCVGRAAGHGREGQHAFGTGQSCCLQRALGIPTPSTGSGHTLFYQACRGTGFAVADHLPAPRNRRSDMS